MSLRLIAPTWLGTLAFVASTSMHYHIVDRHSLVVYHTALSATAYRNPLGVSARLINTGDRALRLVGESYGMDTLASEVPPTLCTNARECINTGDRSMSEKGRGGVKSIPSLFNLNTATALRPNSSILVVYDSTRIYSLDHLTVYPVQFAADSLYVSVVKDDNTMGYAMIRYGGDDRSMPNSTSLANQKRNSFHTGAVLWRLPRINGAEVELQFRECDAKQRAIVTASALHASQLIDLANAFLTDQCSMDSKWFRIWFGHPRRTTWNWVRSAFSAMQNQPLRMKYDCSCKQWRMIAFIDHREEDVINLCKPFWLPRIARICYPRAGVLIHELSHLHRTYGARDYVHGIVGARKIARRAPITARENADNYALFATDLWIHRLDRRSSPSAYCVP